MLDNKLALSKHCVIIGGGSHAFTVAEILNLRKDYLPVAVTDRNAEKWGGELAQIPIVGDDEQLKVLYANGIKHFIVGMGSVGHTDVRRLVYERACQEGMLPTSAVIHPTVFVATSAHVESGSTLMAASVINSQSVIGKNCSIGCSSIVEHNCRIRAHAFIAPGVNLAGGVTIGEGAFIGIGATIIQGVSVGRGALVGAGSVVIKDVPDRGKVAGVPARDLIIK